MARDLRSRFVRHLGRCHAWYWVPLGAMAAFVYVYRPIFFGDGPQLGFGWDTIEAYWSDLAFLSRNIGADEWPLWNPFHKAGFPYFAFPERGAYYPLNWILAWYGKATGDVSWWLMQLKDWLHHVIAAITLYVFLRSRGLPRASSMVGGLAWMCSAPWLIHKASSILWPMAWTPLLWLAIDRAVERPTWRRGAALAAVLVLAGTAGSAPGFFYALLTAVPYGLLRVGTAVWDARRKAHVRRTLIGLGVAFGVAGAITVAMLLVSVAPTSELTALSQRADRSLGYVLQLPLPAGETLIGLFAPSNGKQDAYMGVLVMMLIGCAVAMRPMRDRGAPIVLALTSVFFFVLSFGQDAHLLGWLAEHVPGFDLFRISNRYKLPAMPIMAALAGYGAANLEQAARRWDRRRVAALIAVGLTVAVVVYLVVTRPENRGRWPDDAHSIYLVLTGAVLVVAALMVPRSFAMVPVLAMVPLVVYEPQHWIHHHNKALEARVDHREDLTWVEDLDDLTRDWRMFDEFVLGQRSGSRLGLREFRGYPAGASLEYRRYHRVITYAKRHPEILQAFNIRYLMHRGHHRAGLGPNHLKKPPDQLAPRHYRRLHVGRCATLRRPELCPVFEANHALPAALWLGAIQVEKNDAGGALLDNLRRQLDSSDGAVRVASIEERELAGIGADRAARLRERAAAPPDMVAGKVVSLTANRIEVTVDAPAEGIVVVNDTMYPGWKVWVDGEPATPLYANWLVRGVAVDAGRHTIVWHFEPRRHRAYYGLWSLGLLTLLAAAFVRRREPAASAPDAAGTAPPAAP